MFNVYAHTAIDSIQNGKKQFIDMFVKHEELKQTLTSFVDQQTQYSKSMFDSFYTTGMRLNSIVTASNFLDETRTLFEEATQYFTPTTSKSKKK